ncbi:MAG TPA: hypothetical protein VJ600_11355 [Holophagaceae bacterium]|nr:hypothetical protein [Holophagaceae bacterium]
MAAVLLLAFLAGRPRPKRQPHYWKDAQGVVHMTDAPPPPGAEILPGPPREGVAPVLPKAPPPDPLASLPPDQRLRWETLRARLTLAKTPEARSVVVHEIIQEARWGKGHRASLLAPLLAFAFLALVGWWLAFALQGFWRPATLGVFLLLGLALADLLVVEVVNRPQLPRLREDLRILLDLPGNNPPEARAELDARLTELEAANAFGAMPWRFPGAVARLEASLNRRLGGA